jgi:hypothetical protein
MVDESTASAIHEALFCEEGLNVYAVIDAASCPGLDAKFNEYGPEFECLFAGKLKQDVARAAPYLVLLEPDSDFTRWLIAEGWGNHWGIFTASPVDLKRMRRQLRKYLMVRDPENSPVYFRYYDPRVLRVYLPTCTAQEADFVYGETLWFAMENSDGSALLRFPLRNGEPRRRLVPVAAPAPAPA